MREIIPGGKAVARRSSLWSCSLGTTSIGYWTVLKDKKRHQHGRYSQTRKLNFEHDNDMIAFIWFFFYFCSWLLKPSTHGIWTNSSTTILSQKKRFLVNWSDGKETNHEMCRKAYQKEKIWWILAPCEQIKMNYGQILQNEA